MSKGDIPQYAGEMADFHAAFQPELEALIDQLPLRSDMRVLDVACGDGFYTSLLARRLKRPGQVIGLDVSHDFLEQARQRLHKSPPECDVAFWEGKIEGLENIETVFDLIWCAQSLYSLPDPLQTIKALTAAARPGGLVVVFDNDTLHQAHLPWPGKLELAVRTAEYEALRSETAHPEKYYVGRRLPALLALAGLESVAFKTQAIDRGLPLEDRLSGFLAAHFKRLGERVLPFLDADNARHFQALTDPSSKDYMPSQPLFCMSWINILASGRRPL